MALKTTDASAWGEGAPPSPLMDLRSARSGPFTERVVVLGLSYSDYCRRPLPKRLAAVTCGGHNWNRQAVAGRRWARRARSSGSAYELGRHLDGRDVLGDRR